MHPARTTVLLALASATLTVVVLFAQSNPEAAKIPNPVAADAASIATGKQVYTRYCAVCHGVNGEGGSGSDISPPAPDLTDKSDINVAFARRCTAVLNITCICGPTPCPQIARFMRVCGARIRQGFCGPLGHCYRAIALCPCGRVAVV